MSPDPNDPASLERIDFTAERQRHADLLARDEVLAEIDSLLVGGASWVLLTGTPGVGKSAILARHLANVEAASDADRVREKIAGTSRRLARWAEQLERKVRTKERWAVVCHFLRRGDWARPQVVAASLARQIEDRFIDERDANAAPERRLGELLERVSRNVLATESLRLLLVLDGLDEADDEAGGAPLSAFLPAPLPPRVAVLASSRPMHADLAWVEPYAPSVIDLDAPRWSASNEAACRAFWDRAGKELGLSHGFIEQVVQRAAGNMLYSVELAEWLRKVPPEERRIEEIPRTLRDIFARLWTHVTRLSGEQERPIKRALGVLCASPSPLPLSALAEQAGWVEGVTVTSFLRIARPFLQRVEVEGSEDAYRPFHDELRALVAEQLAGEGIAPAPGGGAVFEQAEARGPLDMLRSIASAMTQAIAPITDRHAFLVGVGRYEDRNVGDLRFCVDDVVALADTLQNKLGYRTVLAMHDAIGDDRLLPRRNRVKSELKRLARSLGPNDLLLVHFSCHGKLLDGRPVLLLSDSSEETLAESTLAVDDVKKILLECPARRKVLLLDACHAGVALGRDAGRPALDPTFVKNVFELAEGLAVLAGSTSQQIAMERPDAKRGVFTSFVIEGLEGKADRSDPPKGFVTVDDLSYFVTDRVQQWTRERCLDLQIPTARIEGTGSMILADFRDQKGAPVNLESTGR